jgi:hypothetical protein
MTPRLAESGSRRLSDSPSFLLNIQKPTPRLAASVSHRLPDSPSRRVADSPNRRVGESFFDYEYLREFEAKIGTAQKVV